MYYGLSLSTWLNWEMTRFVESALSACVWGGSQRQPRCAYFDQAKGVTCWWISTLNSSWEAGRPWRQSQAPYFSCLLPGFQEANKAAFLPDVLLSEFFCLLKGQARQTAGHRQKPLTVWAKLSSSIKWLLLDARQGKKILTNAVWPSKRWRVYLPNWAVLSKYLRL